MELFVADLWDVLLQDDKIGSKIFEDYCRKLMASPPARSFLCHICFPDEGYHFKLETNFGGCNTIRLGSDITMAAMYGDSMTLLYSINKPSQPLFDFIYKYNTGKVHAFQAAVHATNKVTDGLFCELRETVGNLALYTLIPAENLNEFITRPTYPGNGEFPVVRHILILNRTKSWLFDCGITLVMIEHYLRSNRQDTILRYTMNELFMAI